jgi:pantoate--beta-alanine ligase
MGALHEGHLALVALAHERADVVIVSIFVNPTQFAPTEDLASYPRDLDRDLALCRAASVDAVFAPAASELYPEGAQTWVEVAEIAKPLCGASRPHFFRGVATVVAKLLAAARPHVAVFGEKDFQQLAVVRRMTADLALDVEIVPGPLIRAADGLALSSRNQYLSPDDRRRALSLHRALFAMRDAGDRDAARLSEMGKSLLEVDRLDYLEIVDPVSLRPVADARDGRALVAAFVGRTRLIDNVALDGP